MNKPKIGLRQADGSFFPILDESEPGKKRLLLSPAKPQQTSVKIELFRSEEEGFDASQQLGTLALEKKDEADLQDMELVLDLDADGVLAASAQTSDHSQHQSFKVDLKDYQTSTSERSDKDILSDDSLDKWDLDTLDDLEMPEEESAVLDLPESETEAIPEPKSDSEILADEHLDSFELDDVGDLDAEFPEAEAEAEAEAETPAETDELGDFGDLDTFSLEDEPADHSLEESLEETPEEEVEEARPAPVSDDDFDPFSMDEGEAIELSDTEAPAPPEKKETKREAWQDFSMDEDEKPLELNDDLGDFSMDDLSDLDEELSSKPEPAATRKSSLPEEDLSGLDEDFNPEASWDEDPQPDFSQPAEEKPSKTPKAVKTSNRSAPKAPRVPSSPSLGGAVDKTALVLSLATLGLLVMTILILLFMNLVKTPQIPPIKPEVMAPYSPSLADSAGRTPSGVLQLDFSHPAALPTITSAGGSLLSVPVQLEKARVTMSLAPGDTAADVERRFDLKPGQALNW